MKKLFLIIAAVMMAVSVMGQQSLPRTYCGCTLGKTVYDDLFDRNLSLPQSANIPEGLSYAKEACIYVGDFVVEGHHFSILILSFYKDTLYRMEFLDVEINSDVMGLNRTFVRDYKAKYNSLKRWISSNDMDDDLFVTCSKTDGTLGVTIFGSEKSLRMSISMND